MSLTVSPAIPLRDAPRDHIMVVSSPAEDRVALVVKVRGIVTSIDLTRSGAHALRAALPVPVKK